MTAPELVLRRGNRIVASMGFVIACTVVLAFPMAAGAEDGCPSGQRQGTIAGGASGCVSIAGGSATPSGAPQELPNPLPTSDIPTIVGNIIRAGFGIVGSLALAMFVWGGFLWLTSGGSPERIKKGRDTMVWAGIGLGVIFASYAIVQFIVQVVANRT